MMEQKTKEQLQGQIPPLRQRLELGMKVARVFSRAGRQDPLAIQIEEVLVESFEQLHISEKSIQMFKQRLEKVRQSAPHAYLEDTYAVGGILIYCGILLPALTGLGVPDFPSRLTWIAFVVAFPCAVGFFLARFLKERNSISGYGRIHSVLATIAEIAILTATTSLFFHVWNIAGWIFMFWGVAIFFGYYYYRFVIYFKPILESITDILKNISDTPPAKQGEAEKQAT